MTTIRVVDVQDRTFESLYEKYILNNKQVIEHEGRVFLTNALQSNETNWRNVRVGKAIPAGIICDNPLLNTNVVHTNHKNKITFTWETVTIHLECVSTWCTIHMPSGKLAHATNVVRFPVPRLVFVLARSADKCSVDKFIEYLQDQHTFQTIRLIVDETDVTLRTVKRQSTNDESGTVSLSDILPCYLHLRARDMNLSHELVIRFDSPATVHLPSARIKRHAYTTIVNKGGTRDGLGVVRPIVESTASPNTRDSSLYPRNVIYYDVQKMAPASLSSSLFLLPDIYLHDEYVPGKINNRVFLSVGDPVNEILHFVVYPPLLFSDAHIPPPSREQKNDEERFLGFSSTSNAMQFIEKYSAIPSCLCLYEPPFVLLVYGDGHVWCMTIDVETVASVSNASLERLFTAYRTVAMDKKIDGNIPLYFVSICRKFIQAIM